MSEIRKDYVLNSWVVISEERKYRPHSIITQKKREKKDNCSFCPGHETETPPEIIAYRKPESKPNEDGWWVRTVPNKYPALRIEGNVVHKKEHLFQYMNGIGAHEVVIECREHELSVATLSNGQIEELLNMYRDRYIDLTRDIRLKYILIFRNHGEEAGASIEHPHSQIIATPMIPRRILDELEGAKNYYYDTGGICIYDEIINNEIDKGERVIETNEKFIAICPYASRFPYETWIIPKAHDPVFEDMEYEEKKALANILKSVLRKLYVLLDNPPYNFYIHTSPCDRNDYRFYHWHIEITPRLTRAAGFERGTGFYINPLSPENAASELREMSTS